MKWKQFEKNHLNMKTWFDRECRAKTYKALRRVVPKLPPEALPANLLVFGPSNVLGSCAPVRGTLLYLDVSLESEHQAEVDFTVAHEFAHIARGTWGNNKTRRLQLREEAQTDKLAESWGFKKPKEKD